MGGFGGGVPGGDFASFQNTMMQDPAMMQEMMQSPMVRVRCHQSPAPARPVADVCVVPPRASLSLNTHTDLAPPSVGVSSVSCV